MVSKLQKFDVTYGYFEPIFGVKRIEASNIQEAEDLAEEFIAEQNRAFPGSDYTIEDISPVEELPTTGCNKEKN